MVEADVVVVGAGLAGLACAQRLTRAGISTVVLEAGDAVGGRVRTDVIDGFRCDRGFQLLNPAYPVLRRTLDVAHLDLKPFGAGVVVATGDRRAVLADPRREPARLPGTLAAPVGSLADKVRFAAWAARSLLPVRRILAAPDRPWGDDLDAAGVVGPLRTGVVEPFLAGVLAEDDGSTSTAFVRLLVRSFLLGTPAVPALGMGRLPEVLAALLPAGTVRLGCRVDEVGPGRVRLAEDAEQHVRAVVVATDPATAGRLLELDVPSTKALTTFWHTAPEAPTAEPLLHLDGERRGPVVNTAVVTAAAPSYAPAGRPLIATTVLGARGSAPDEAEARRHAGAIYGVDPADWELVTTSVVADALPALPPPLRVRRPVDLGDGVFVAGDHRDTASIQGALVSGRRAATAVLARLGVRARP